MRFGGIVRVAVGAAVLAGVAAGGWYLYRQLTVTAPDRADVAYSDRSSRNKMDVYLPKVGTAPFPVVIWVHGGAFKMGSKADPQSLAALMAAGYAVVAINYRFTDTSIWPAQLEDVQAAVELVQSGGAGAELDGARVALFGASAGGFLVSATGLSLAAPAQNPVQAVVDWFGPVEFTTMDADMEATGLTRATGRNDAAESPESALVGKVVKDDPIAAAAVSPLAILAELPKGTALPPFLIMHGDADNFVAPGQSERLRDGLTARGGMVEFALLAGAGHGSGAFQEPSAVGQVVAFLDSHLK